MSSKSVLFFPVFFKALPVLLNIRKNPLCRLFLIFSIPIIRKGIPSPECPDNSIKLELFKVNFSTFCFKFSLDFLSLSFRSAFFDYLWSFVN